MTARKKPPPNDLLRDARLSRLSPSGSGRPMSRQELAEQVNAYLWKQHKRRANLDENDVGLLERGENRWPGELRREAFRSVLGAATDAELGFYVNRRPRAGVEAVTGTRRAVVATERDYLGRALAAAGAPLMLAQPSGSPALTLEDLDRFEAVVSMARDYSGEMLVAFLGECLDQCNIDDGIRGPRYALPSALGIVAVVSQKARTAKLSSRRPLFGIGARAAEFTGWLYRDSGQSSAADYWRDRASEWAMEATDWAMPGYVLIKKSQSAWDERDAGRMLGLAEAVQEGPWRLPPRIMAEAVQQQARGLAMLNAGRRQVDEVLKRAEDLLGGADERTVLAVHYDSALFRLQKAICYGESDRPEEAAEIYQATLTPTVFSTRDYAYFSTLKAQTLAAAHRPDDAAETGSAVMGAAFAAGSVRTVRELSRLRYRLLPWRGRPTVDSFMRLMQACDQSSHSAMD